MFSGFFSLLFQVILCFHLSPLNVFFPVSASVSTVNLCSSYRNVCVNLLDHVGCPGSSRQIGGCGVFTSTSRSEALANFTSTCACGAFDVGGVRIGEDLVDALVKADIGGQIVNLPTSLMAGSVQVNDIDYCQSFTNQCNNYLTKINCPIGLRQLQSCGQNLSLPADPALAAGICACGQFDIGGPRIVEHVIDFIMKPHVAALTASPAPPALLPINFCTTYNSTCCAFFQHVQCHQRDRVYSACTTTDPIATFPGDDFAQCNCGSMALTVSSTRISEDITDNEIKNDIPALLVLSSSTPFNPTTPVYDYCSSYENACRDWMEKLNCPAANQTINACGGVNSTPNPGATLASNLQAVCECGKVQIASGRIVELLIDSILAKDLTREIPAPAIVMANSARQSVNPILFHYIALLLVLCGIWI